ncbi:hypothetical protein CVU76_02665 [Candidatus Dojkabacteria bacterium HGW-Dojkabacteria-1]|uniref:UDP-N-acetylglucosamine--N-acetylmuramyl-(pentapeptide) pyrophosphoryl-undecaprenol N-acetylglucosamine transferase n=1 Tax=Candidatus Dojkabacteria bacterium HGW-Dojkabacteria-1 TaxID=2013761 RepID=A0A2N2F3X1_9BACT|nr:MAG: hypothetical protein CVU76_02665 [Candidatus Dojkabacteria bacterium HGW-Dojkabacteria-1]
MQNKNNKKILVVGGGSGGHLSSANALLESMLDEYMIPAENIVYVGGDLGMEGERVGNSLEQKQMVNKPYSVYFLRAGKLQRQISFNTVKLLFRTILGFFDAVKILKIEKPNLVISTGGFVSVPICIISWISKIPIYLHEQTASVGLSNKIVGKLAKRVYVSFKESTKYFSKGKALHVGNNVRKAIFTKEKNDNTSKEIVEIFKNSKEFPVIYVSGGSLGSHILNRKVISSLNQLLEKYSVILQTGDNQQFKDFEYALGKKLELDENISRRFLPVKYIEKENIGYVLNNMHLFVGRSGANTVYEIGVLKKNALFIPIPWVTHNEQYLNAKVLENIGTAKILEEKYLTESNLLDEIQRLEEQLKLREIQYEKLDELFPINATSRILDDILKEK